MRRIRRPSGAVAAGRLESATATRPNMFQAVEQLLLADQSIGSDSRTGSLAEQGPDRPSCFGCCDSGLAWAGRKAG